MVYVGANDGMLHGIRASDGQEILAYIPSSVYSSGSKEGLHFLTDPNYEHRFYVDLTPTVSDVYINSAWHTVLIGGLGGGGKGYFALDITDPSQFSTAAPESLVLWEFNSTNLPNSDGDNLGYTYARPTIANTAAGWFAFFGNGYNSASGHAALYAVKLSGPSGTAAASGNGKPWTTSDYVMIDVDKNTTMTDNGMSTPAVVDLNGDGVADRVYAGDLQGRMWAFNIEDSTETNWASAYMTGNGANATSTPLFTATTSDLTTPEPITTRPVVIKNTKVTDNGSGNNSNLPNVLVLFGTGRYLDNLQDPEDKDAQTFYGIWDHGSKDLDRSSDLVSQLPNDSALNTDSQWRIPTDNSVNYSDTSKTVNNGWMMDLDAGDPSGSTGGERVVTNYIVRSDVLLFNTLIPDATICSAGGSGYFMALDALSGGRTTEAQFDVNGDGIVNIGDLQGGSAVSGEAQNGVSGAPATLGNYEYNNSTDNTNSGSDGDAKDNLRKRVMKPIDDAGTGRMSWEEIRN